MTAPRREVLAEGVEIWCGDCREVLPMIGKVDAVVTSPPYNQLVHSTNGTGMHKGNGWVEKSGGGYASYSDDMPEEDYKKWMQELFRSWRSICKGLVWINHKTRYRNKKGIHPLHLFDGPIYSEIVWDRCGSMTLNAQKFAPSHEYIIGFGEPHYWDRSEDMRMSVWRVPPENGRKDHPCPFPIQLILPIIRASVPPNGRVFDPFMGSGTTGVACVKMGRGFVGSEIDPGYFDIARRRISEALAQPDIFIPAPQPKSKQEHLL